MQTHRHELQAVVVEGPFDVMRRPFFFLRSREIAEESDTPYVANNSPVRLPVNVRSSGIWLGLLAVLILAAGLQLVLRLGLSNRDSFDYMLAAIKLNEHGVVDYLSSISNIYENRVSIVFPLAVILRLLGTTQASSTLLPFSATLLTIVLVFFLGYFVSPRVGLIAALIMATLPMHVGLATSILPDSLIPFYSTASLLCLWLGLRHGRLWLLVLSGLFLFLAFQARATSAVLVVPLILTAMWSNRRSARAILTPTVTFFVLLALFWLILYVIAGDPLVQYRWLLQDGTMEHFAGTGEFMGHFKNTVLRLNPDFNLVFQLAFLALIVGLLKSREREEYRLPLLTFVFLYLFFEFGSTSLTSYLPIWKFDRFLTILTVPAALLIAIAANDLTTTKTKGRRLLVFSLLSAQIVFGVVYVFMFGQFITTAVHVEKDTYKRVIHRLDDYDGATVAVVHEKWTRWGPVYAAFEGNRFYFQPLEGLSRQDLETGTIVIFAPTIIAASGNKSIKIDEFPALDGLPRKVPPGWKLLFVEPLVSAMEGYGGEDVMVYQVSR